MAQASSFTPLVPSSGAPGAAGTRASLFAALDGASFTIPLSLGSITVVYAKVGGPYMCTAVLTTLLAIALVQVVTAGAQRPLLWSARFFEATTLAAMIGRAGELAHDWGVADTPELRLALVCALGAGAGLVVGVLFAIRADRFSRHIPTPVFAGFSNSIAVGLLLSQAGSLRRLLAGDAAATVALLALASFAVGVAVRRWLPRWPAASCAIGLGLAAGAALHLLGAPVTMVGTGSFMLAPAVLFADVDSLAHAAHSMPMLTWLLTNAAILGTMMFINTSLSAQALSHIDDRPRDGAGRLAVGSAFLTLIGAAGAVPLSGALQASTAALRFAPFSARLMLFSAGVIALVAAAGVLAIVPLAAVAGTLVCEAFYMVDRPSLRLAREWIARRTLSRQQRENLALVALVTGTAVVANMVAAVVAGLMLGLLMFASRHMIPPVRASWDGTQISSNCARSRGDVQFLAAHGSEIRVVELQGDLFFGSVDALDRALRGALHGARCIVVDWTDVRHVDTSAIQAWGKFEQAARAANVSVVHTDPAVASAELGAALRGVLRPEALAPDLDRALERAENHILLARPEPREITAHMDAMSLFRGFDDSERAALEAAMTQRVVPAGEVVVRAGDPGEELMIVLQGSASVLVPDGAGHMVRVASLRRGAVIGEIAFFDAAPRSATVVASDSVLVAVLDRAAYDGLRARHAALVEKLLANIAVYLATRLRHTTELAAARLARRRH